MQVAEVDDFLTLDDYSLIYPLICAKPDQTEHPEAMRRAQVCVGIHERDAAHASGVFVNKWISPISVARRRRRS